MQLVAFRCRCDSIFAGISAGVMGPKSGKESVSGDCSGFDQAEAVMKTSVALVEVGIHEKDGEAMATDTVVDSP